MKTAVSLPDEIFQSAEALAERLGVSRSQLYANALAAFLAQHERAAITAKLNAVYTNAAGAPVDRGLAALQARSLPRDDAW